MSSVYHPYPHSHQRTKNTLKILLRIYLPLNPTPLSHLPQVFCLSPWVGAALRAVRVSLYLPLANVPTC